MRYRNPVIIALLTSTTTAMAMDLAPLWDFNKPEVSEQRFRTALETATGDDALEIQLRLERECEAAKAPDHYVFEELEILYRARGDEGRANHYAQLWKSDSHVKR